MGRAAGWLHWIHLAPVAVLVLEAVAAVLTRSGIGTVIVVGAPLGGGRRGAPARRRGGVDVAAHRASHGWWRAFATAVNLVAPPLVLRAVRHETTIGAVTAPAHRITNDSLEPVHPE